MTARLAPGRYGFDEVAVGNSIDAGSVRVTAAQIDAFAELTGDRFEIHMSDAAAARHGFQARVAHGLLVLSLIDGLKNQAPAQFRAQASLGWDWSFRGPVLAEDRLSVVITVAEKREITARDRGILRLAFEVKNQQGTIVQQGENLLMVYR